MQKARIDPQERKKERKSNVRMKIGLIDAVLLTDGVTNRFDFPRQQKRRHSKECRRLAKPHAITRVTLMHSPIQCIKKASRSIKKS